MATDLKAGDIVRYGGGISALFKLVSPHAGGWHGEHVLGGLQFGFNNLTKASDVDIAYCKLKRPDWFEKPSFLTNLTFELLREKNLERCEKGFKHTLDSWSVAEWGNATAGECGEACNVAKKILRFRDNVAGNKKSKEEYVKELSHELAGTLIYLDLWAASQGINLAHAVIDEFNKKSDEIGSDIKI